MMKPGMCCPQGSPERVEGPAAGSRREMVSTGTARSGSRCPPLFLLLLILSSSCHMLHGQVHLSLSPSSSPRGVEEEVGDGGVVLRLQ
ncbi:hypothetical protein JOQ06_012558, partial [Pogonophryne albipinna]